MSGGLLDQTQSFIDACQSAWHDQGAMMPAAASLFELD